MNGLDPIPTPPLARDAFQVGILLEPLSGAPGVLHSWMRLRVCRACILSMLLAVVAARSEGRDIAQGDVTNGFRTVIHPQVAFWSGDDVRLQTLVSVEFVGQKPPEAAFYAPKKSFLAIALWDSHGKEIPRRPWRKYYVNDAAPEIDLSSRARIFKPSRAIEIAAYFNVLDEFDVRAPGPHTLTVEARIYLCSSPSRAQLLKLPTLAVPINIPRVDSPPLLGPTGTMISTVTVMLLTILLLYLRVRRLLNPESEEAEAMGSNIASHQPQELPIAPP